MRNRLVNFIFTDVGEMASEEAGHHVDVVPVDLPAPAGWSKKVLSCTISFFFIFFFLFV